MAAAAASLHVLLDRSIDYAGMFPPCSLELEPALDNQARYVRSADAWMLNGFVLAPGQFEAAKKILSQFDPIHPLRVSVLGPKTDNPMAFCEALEETNDAIRKLSAHNVDLVSVSQLEMSLPDDVDLALLKDARSIIGSLPAFWEAPGVKAEQTIALLAQLNSEIDTPTFGYKLRTGGVTEDAFPTSATIAKALVSPATHQVPIKFTAGLHHPVRLFHDSVQTRMHGFLNVLGAGVLALEYDWTPKEISQMLDDEDLDAFSFTEDFFAWREWEIGTEAITARRELVTSFGSCSFDEPRDDLRALKLL